MKSCTGICYIIHWQNQHFRGLHLLGWQRSPERNLLEKVTNRATMFQKNWSPMGYMELYPRIQNSSIVLVIILSLAHSSSEPAFANWWTISFSTAILCPYQLYSVMSIQFHHRLTVVPNWLDPSNVNVLIKIWLWKKIWTAEESSRTSKTFWLQQYHT